MKKMTSSNSRLFRVFFVASSTRPWRTDRPAIISPRWLPFSSTGWLGCSTSFTSPQLSSSYARSFDRASSGFSGTWMTQTSTPYRKWFICQSPGKTTVGKLDKNNDNTPFESVTTYIIQAGFQPVSNRLSNGRWPYFVPLTYLDCFILARQAKKVVNNMKFAIIAWCMRLLMHAK